MKPKLLLLVAIVAFASAVAGVFLGRYFFPRPKAAGVELHDVLHSKLDLDDRQKAKIELLEQGFAVRRRALEKCPQAPRQRAAVELCRRSGTSRCWLSSRMWLACQKLPSAKYVYYKLLETP